ncbi:MAG TPA: hypothetical protein VLW54_08620 [Candidatus Acidoferrales bacterium]|nr:hypothetical protein [Candidatus Acidoferrales bacterium]
MVVTTLFLLGGVVLVLCGGLGINPFKETTTSFLVAAFLGLMGAAGILVLLNVAINISMIADARMRELQIHSSSGVVRKWLTGCAAIAALLVGVVAGGTYLSKEEALRAVRTQADQVLKQNENLLEEISQRLASGKPGDYKRVNEIRNFLQARRGGLPRLTLIYSARFGDKLAFYKVNEYFAPNYENEEYTPTYFPCMQNIDCDYLTRFFSGESVEVLKKYTFRDDEFYIYIPYVGKGSRYVLQFTRQSEYGKIGS